MPKMLSLTPPKGYKYLYHGSYMPFNVPDLSKSKKGKDFGSGFYLTENLVMARKWAKRQARYEHRQKGYVMQFMVKEDCWPPVGTLVFKSAGSLWLNYIMYNRNKLPKKCKLKIQKSYDVIIGPTADNDVSFSLDQYKLYLNGNPYGFNEEDTLDDLKPHVLADQICIKTKRGLSYISYVDKEEVPV